jgi:hypothetical protein
MNLEETLDYQLQREHIDREEKTPVAMLVENEKSR